MKKFFDDFSKFINRGNVIDLAVGVIIGGAFQTIVNSLVNDIISPLIGLVANTNFDYLVLKIGDVEVKYGSFITSVIKFIIMAFVIFWLVKGINKVNEVTHPKKAEAPAAPTTKKCPYCMSEIDINAKKCPHCTSNL